MSDPKPRRRRQLGQAMIEFALVMPMLVFLLMGVFDLGRAIYAYSVVSSAAREGARYGVLKPTDTAGIEAVARANTVTLEKSDLTVTSSCVSGCAWNTGLNVIVTYQFHPVTAFFTTLTLRATSTMIIE